MPQCQQGADCTAFLDVTSCGVFKTLPITCELHRHGREPGQYLALALLWPSTVVVTPSDQIELSKHLQGGGVDAKPYELETAYLINPNV